MQFKKKKKKQTVQRPKKKKKEKIKKTRKGFMSVCLSRQRQRPSPRKLDGGTGIRVTGVPAGGEAEDGAVLVLGLTGLCAVVTPEDKSGCAYNVEFLPPPAAAATDPNAFPYTLPVPPHPPPPPPPPPPPSPMLPAYIERGAWGIITLPRMPIP